jgi:hypothetical protein
MELRVNDYVRTRQGKIFKWDRYMTTTEEKCRDVDSPYIYVNQNDIIKSSPNIIDILDVGDYVDRLRVVEKEEDYIVIENFDEHIIITKEDNINSIVTKEQFEEMKYEIK